MLTNLQTSFKHLLKLYLLFIVVGCSGVIWHMSGGGRGEWPLFVMIGLQLTYVMKSFVRALVRIFIFIIFFFHSPTPGD